MGGILPFNWIFGYYLGNYISAYHAGKDIRLYNQKELIIGESMLLFKDANRTLNSLSQNQTKYSMLPALPAAALGALVYLFAGLKALAGNIGIGAVLQYAGSIGEFTAGFTGLMSELAALKANSGALRLYFDFMGLESWDVRGGAAAARNGGQYEIEYRGVSLKYPRAQNYALRNLSFKLPCGQRTAIVGMNGSGKTSAIKLLCRLYDPSEGKITLNGIDIREYGRADYWRLLSVVFQDFRLFSFGLGQNVAADMDADCAEAINCLDKSGFRERYRSLPDGLRTPLYKDFDENGVEISGGEAQKIALARALYKNAPLIILDEPTAALDPIAEAEMYSRLNEFASGKTAIFISHRLSSCRFCDEILVLDKGELVQRGSHASLLSDQSGKYYELWNAQAQHYQAEIL
jgi:ATP-binding cassette subfamily B protein